MGKVGNFGELIGKVIAIVDCCVCKAISKDKLLISCNNGHLICHVCHTQLKMRNCRVCQEPCIQCEGACPVCRSHVIRPNHLASKLAQTILQEVRGTCRFQNYGCERLGTIKELTVHELCCRYRTIPCPAHFNSAVCTWYGSIKSLGQHARERPCVRVLEAKHPSVIKAALNK